MLNGCVDFKVHDVEISKFSNAGLTIRGYPQRGVVYRSSFVSNFKCQTTPVDCLGYGVAVYGNGSPPPLALGGPALAASEQRLLPISSSACGLPPDARAVSVNVTAISAAASGSLTLFPGDRALPFTTTISFATGKTRANSAVVGLALDATGTIRVKSSSSGWWTWCSM